MERWLTIVLGALAVAVAVALSWQGISHWRPAKTELGHAKADAGVATAAYTESDAAPEPVGAPLPAWTPHDGGVGFTMPGGAPVPQLDPDAPRSVRFGVVLVTYAGAEDAPRSARAKHDALELAGTLAAQAKDDFHAAVRKGDEGSADDIGWMHRRVIEPAPEYVLFSLPVGGVSDPIDTPRGYWIVKRIE